MKRCSENCIHLRTTCTADRTPAKYFDGVGGDEFDRSADDLHGRGGAREISDRTFPQVRKRCILDERNWPDGAARDAKRRRMSEKSAKVADKSSAKSFGGRNRGGSWVEEVTTTTRTLLGDTDDAVTTSRKVGQMTASLWMIGGRNPQRLPRHLVILTMQWAACTAGKAPAHLALAIFQAIWKGATLHVRTRKRLQPMELQCRQLPKTTLRRLGMHVKGSACRHYLTRSGCILWSIFSMLLTVSRIPSRSI